MIAISYSESLKFTRAEAKIASLSFIEAQIAYILPPGIIGVLQLCKFHLL